MPTYNLFVYQHKDTLLALLGKYNIDHRSVIICQASPAYAGLSIHTSNKLSITAVTELTRELTALLKIPVVITGNIPPAALMPIPLSAYLKTGEQLNQEIEPIIKKIKQCNLIAAIQANTASENFTPQQQQFAPHSIAYCNLL